MTGSAPPRPIDPEQFRDLCGCFITGVTVVTTTTADGVPVGMTANSFASVSLEPPLVSVNVDRSAELHRHLLQVPAFRIHILRDDQETLSRRFAEPHPDRFGPTAWSWDEQGLPALEQVLASLVCRRQAVFDAGDHTIVVGLVVGGSSAPGEPLRYYRSSYLPPVPPSP